VPLDIFLKLYNKKSFYIVIVAINNVLLARSCHFFSLGLRRPYVSVYLSTSRMQFPSSRGTENNCPIHQPIGTQRVKSRFGCVEITEYRINNWPSAGKSTLKQMQRSAWGERDIISLCFCFSSIIWFSFGLENFREILFPLCSV